LAEIMAEIYVKNNNKNKLVGCILYIISKVCIYSQLYEKYA